MEEIISKEKILEIRARLCVISGDLNNAERSLFLLKGSLRGTIRGLDAFLTQEEIEQQNKGFGYV
jgi:hypothetical protein